MLFHSPDFLFAFLPAFLALYFCVPRPAKSAVLFAGSLVFSYLLSPELAIILILSVIANYGLALLIARAGPSGRLCFLASALVVNIAPLLYYRYAAFFPAAAPPAPSAISPVLPIALSFFSLQAISYVADVYRRRVGPSTSLIEFGAYLACFPRLIAGPITRYEGARAPRWPRMDRARLDGVQEGIIRFSFGLGKKVALADPLGVAADHMFGAGGGALDFTAAWVGAIACSLQIFMDFSGYSDMAIGLGKMLGHSFPENFEQPYRSTSLTKFWRRWHMTLTAWFRDYVYFPLGGNRGADGGPPPIWALCSCCSPCGISARHWAAHRGAAPPPSLFGGSITPCC